jgi:predicted nucleotidyltransferase
MSVLPSILLQKSKVASVRIFGETLKREAIDDSDTVLGRLSSMVHFSIRISSSPPPLMI